VSRRAAAAGLQLVNEWLSSCVCITEEAAMKPVYPLRENRIETEQSPAMTIHAPHRDEVLQEQMRRLHNARASQRAARHHRAGRSLI
jgi:hypothetical protein